MQLFAGGQVPETDRAVGAAGEGPLAIGREGHAIQISGVAKELTDFLSRFGVPQQNLCVFAATEDVTAVGAKGDGRASSLEATQFLACLQVPQMHQTEVGARDGAAAVRRYSNAGDRVLTVLELFHLLAGVHVP